MSLPGQLLRRWHAAPMPDRPAPITRMSMWSDCTASSRRTLRRMQSDRSGSAVYQVLNQPVGGLPVFTAN